MKIWLDRLLRTYLPLIFCTAMAMSCLSARPRRLAQQVEQERPKPPTIKLLLAQESSGLLLEARGSFAVINPANHKKLSSGKKGKRFYLYPHQIGIRWGEDFPGVFQLQIVPTSSETSFLIDGIQYRGAIEVYNIEGTLQVINEVDVETFLKASLSQTLAPDLSPPVLNALAIIARTDTYYSALLNSTSFYHLDAASVGYRGIGLTRQNLAVEHAVEATRYLVMTYRHQPFPATWTEHCAGKTASYANIFRKQTPVPPGVEAPLALSDRSTAHWKFICEGQEVAQLVKLNRITSIDLFADSISGKIYGLRLRDGDYTQEIDFATLQQGLGSDRLQSNDFNVSVQGNLLSFDGYGRGMGAGLCLYSAKHLIAKGETVPDLLSAFFPHTDLKRMSHYPTTIIAPDNATFVLPKQPKKKPPTLHQ